MNKSEQIDLLAAALAKAEFGQITRNKTVEVTTRSGAKYTFDYAPMEEIMGAIRGPLSEHGLSLSQSVESVDGKWSVETVLMHESGQWKASYVPVILSPRSDKDGVIQPTTAQEFGSAVTYARRYGVSLAVCIVADESDDANITDGNTMKKRTRAFAEPHKATDGAWDGLPEDTKTWLNDIANEMRVMLYKGDVKGACEHLDEANLDADRKVAIWSLFDSKERTAMKKYKAMEKAS